MPDAVEVGLRIDRDSSVAFLTLPSASVIDGRLLRALASAVDAAQCDDAVRSVVLTAAGGGFGPFRGAPPNDGHIWEDDARAQLMVVLAKLAAGPKRFSAGLDGAASGAGLDLLFACDGFYASPRATLGFTAAAPTTPGAGTETRLVTLAGAETAARVVRGTPFDALEAYAADLIDGIVVNDLAGDIAIFARREAALPRGRYRAAFSS